ncbi:unnamed protein product [Parnassius mnemosyne]|uniref:Uncharacterized protein n=1 Tax=Parnassius mnemosyne TaxID=213953 RepID=A0AAV1L6Q2_9NEOP
MSGITYVEYILTTAFHIIKSIFFCFIHCGLGSLDVLGWRCESGCHRIGCTWIGWDLRVGRAHSSHRILGFSDLNNGSRIFGSYQRISDGGGLKFWNRGFRGFDSDIFM